MPRPKGVYRIRRNFTLSRECVRKLEELSHAYDKPMSRILEDLVLGHDIEASEVRVNDSNLVRTLRKLRDIEARADDLMRRE